MKWFVPKKKNDFILAASVSKLQIKETWLMDISILNSSKSISSYAICNVKGKYFMHKHTNNRNYWNFSANRKTAHLICMIIVWFEQENTTKACGYLAYFSLSVCFAGFLLLFFVRLHAANMWIMWTLCESID